MLSLQEAREIQAKEQKHSLTRFSAYFLMIAVAGCLIYKFFFSDYSALIAFGVVLLFLVAKSTRIHLFFRRKEFVGAVVYSNIVVEPVKKYASHQAGATYASYDVAMLELIAADENGKSLRINVGYNGAWGEYKIGDKVALLRFVDQPIRVE
jgi:hypothetical protein